MENDICAFRRLCDRRSTRAGLLASRYPASREALEFLAAVAGFQARIDPARPLASRADLVALMLGSGPATLREAARDLDDRECERAIAAFLARRDLTSVSGFFARVLLQPVFASKPRPPTPRADGPAPSPWACPYCGHPPQLGCLRPEGHGTALSLLCSLCFAESAFPRGQCPACGETDERLQACYGAPEPDHVQVQACEACRRYVLAVSLAKEPEAIPDVDEVAALPLDVWAHEHGFRKLHPNLVGI